MPLKFNLRGLEGAPRNDGRLVQVALETVRRPTKAGARDMLP